MAWVVKAWKPEALAAAEREARRVRRGEITARKGRATLHDSPLGELFKSTR